MKTQEKNPKKIYAVDNGLRKATAFTFSKDAGRLAENLVFQELFRSGFEVFYWKGKQEVDFVARRREEMWAVNICYGDDIPDHEFSGFRELAKTGILTQRRILITKNTETNNEKDIEIVPLWEWLLEPK